jgi:hypothetical protein
MDSTLRVHNIRLSVTLLVIILLLSSPVGAAKEEEANYYWKGTLEKVDKGLEPGGSGSSVELMYDQNGMRALLWGYDHADELRVLDSDLGTLAVLEPPYEGFSIEGAIITESGRYVLAWGRSPSNTTDVLVAYNLTDYRIHRGFLPQGKVPLVNIHAMRLIAYDQILVVGGSDVNGTNKLTYIEVGQKSVMKNETIPGNRRVIDIAYDGIQMLVLLGDGSILICSTYDWTAEISYRVFDEPFTAYEVKRGSDWQFGSSDGKITSMTYYEGLSISNITLPRGPVQAVYCMDYFGQLVCAIPSKGSAASTSSEVMLHDGHRWRAQSAVDIDGKVTGMVEDPAVNGTFAITFDDGSVKFFRVVLEKKDLANTNDGPEFMDRYGVIIGPSLVIITIWVILRVRKRHAGSEGT